MAKDAFRLCEKPRLKSRGFDFYVAEASSILVPRMTWSAIPSSRLHQCFDAVAIETFTGGKGFGREAAVDGRFNAQHKLAAEGFRRERIGQGHAVAVKQFNPFLDDFAEFRIHLGLVVAMHAAEREFGATANEALILVAPLDKFRVARRLLFDLLACHKCYSFTVSNALRTSRSW